MKTVASYRVYGRFERVRDKDRTIEVWDGSARNMAVALRRAVSEIMQRPNVKRMRHPRANFEIEVRERVALQKPGGKREKHITKGTASVPHGNSKPAVRRRQSA